jgi:hypothetical protein
MFPLLPCCCCTCIIVAIEAAFICCIWEVLFWLEQSQRLLIWVPLVSSGIFHYNGAARNPGRFAPVSCSPRKVSRFAPLNRYYIIIDEVFFGNYLLLVVCKKNNNSFILVYFNYLFISCIQKKIIIHSFWSTFVKDLKWNFSCKIYKKQHKNSKKAVIGKGRGHGPFDTYIFVILCRCPI